MKKGLFITSAIVLLLAFLVQYAASGNQKAEAVSQEQIRQNIHRIQIPFIANNGQMDELVTFYANTFGGTVFVTKDGEIVYALPNNSSDVETQGIASLKHSPDAIHDTRKINDLHPPTPNSQPPTPNMSLQGVALKETLIGAKVKEIKGENKSATKINYFKGNDQKKWKSNISTYDVVNLGEVYKGIELKLKAYGNNVEKLFHVKPGADPNQIKINLSGIRESKSEVGSQKSEVLALSLDSEFRKPKLRINEHGESSRLGEACPEPTERACPEPVERACPEPVERACPEPVERACPEPVERAKRTQQNNITKGASGLWINEQGQLVAETELGPVTFTKPVAYQEIDGKRVNVAVEYEIYAVPQVVHRKDAKNAKESIVGNTENAGNVCPPLAGVKGVERDSPHVTQPTINPKSKIVNLSSTEIGDPKLEYGFKVASYDKTKELVIDPLLASTFLGSGAEAYSIAIDESGDLYVAGGMAGFDFPTTTGAYDTSYDSSDAFISKLSSDLSSLLASTFLGGSSIDEAYSMIVGTDGNIYVTGVTYSTDFPTTANAYNTHRNGSTYYDVFISKLDSNLSNLIASTYLGGSNDDYVKSIAVNVSGIVYVTGYTQSADFPTTTGAYDTVEKDGYPYTSAFISVLNNNLTNLLASTFLGNSNYDEAHSIAIDSGGNVYVTGKAGGGFPTTTGAYDASENGDGDAFISKFNNDLSLMIASTYLGGYGIDMGKSISTDTNGNVYVTGYTESGDFPTTEDAYQPERRGSSNPYDVFISKLNDDLTDLLASTYIGGSCNDYSNFITLDESGNIYITGYTCSGNFPTTTGAYDTDYNNTDESTKDAFISKLDNNLSIMLASTYLGGSHAGSENAYSLSIDESGNVYVTGSTSSYDFPTTTGAYDTSTNAHYYSYVSNSADVFVSKLDSNLSAEEDKTDDGDEPEEEEYIDFSGTWKGKYSSNRVDMKITIKLNKKNKKKFSGTWKTSGGAYGDCTIKYNKKGIPKLKIIETYPCDGSFKGKLTYYTDTYFEYEIKGSDCESSVKAEGYASKKN